MLVTEVPLIASDSKSWFVSDDTFHQNVNVAGPESVVCRVEDWLLVIRPLWAAANPSWVTVFSTNQGTSPPLTHARFVAFSARAKSSLVNTETTNPQLRTLVP